MFPWGLLCSPRQMRKTHWRFAFMAEKMPTSCFMRTAGIAIHTSMAPEQRSSCIGIIVATTLSIGDRAGTFPGMPSKQMLHIVLVKEEHGIGIGPESGPDRTATYAGHQMTIVLSKQ